jgi:hypothetical protein
MTRISRCRRRQYLRSGSPTTRITGDVAITASVIAQKDSVRVDAARPRLIRPALTVPLCAQFGPPDRLAVTLSANPAPSQGTVEAGA